MKTTLNSAIATILAIITSVLFPMHGNAQITYSSSGLSINGAPEHSYLSLTIDKYPGMYWTCKTSNFFQLDVSPANPRLAGTGDEVVFYNTVERTFNNIQVANVYNYSDARAKENVQSLSSGLNTVLNLRPVSYTWKGSNETSAITTFSETDTLTAYGPGENNTTQYGFLAQEVEQVFPDAVKTDKEGHKLINYTAIIPVLVQSIQEMQGIINEQATTIATLNSRTIEGNTSMAKSINKILSCSPNPTRSDITFSYKIDTNASDAFILISNLTGNQEMRVESLYGKTSTTVNVSTLNPGIHIATLVVKDNVQDSRQFVVTR